jgi:tetratricopeptide (TPR) repeat protein
LLAAGATSQVLALLLPLDWPRTDPDSTLDGAASDIERTRLRRLDATVRGLNVSGIRTVVISGRSAMHPWCSDALQESLERPSVSATDIQPSEVPELEGPAAEVQDLLSEERRSVTPIEARALIGLAALQVRIDDLIASQHVHDGIFRRFASALVAHDELRADARCLSLARQPLRLDRIDRVLVVGGSAGFVLRHCAMYGDDELRVPSPLARALVDALLRDRGTEESAHQTLAAYHRELDGAVSPNALSHAAAIAWLEKTHHLANAGAAAELEWRQQAKVGRDQYWECARRLSREGRYSDASALYQECLDQFGDDSYTHHYLGFNLDHARADLAQVRSHYKTAVAMDPENPWWNSRWVTFLIGHGTLREAKEELARALSTLDPDDDRIEGSPWLALHFHRWVIRRWLALGYVGEARDVLELIPAQWIAQNRDLAVVAQLVGDAEESVELGEAVYPPGTLVAERWSPSVTPELNGGGSRRIRWFPGRVVSASDAEVVLVLADPSTHTAFRVVYPAKDWQRSANQAPRQAQGYVEVAEYEDSSRQVRMVFPLSGESLAEDASDVSERLGWLTA